jgi:curved DNA-binding protein CbpA
MDYYEILGVNRTASLEDVNDTYRKLAMEHHPDANLDNPKPAAEKFKKIAMAYEAISDPNKRARYNRDHPPRKKPKLKPKPKLQSEYEGPKPGVDYKTGRAPTHDIWGQPLSPEERKQWEIDAAVEDLDLATAKKGGRMNNPEAVRKWMEARKNNKRPPPRDPNNFYDAFAREYESGGPKHVR